MWLHIKGVVGGRTSG